MQKSLANLLGNLLIDIGKKIKAGTCEMTEEEQLDLFAAISHKALTKEQACKFLNVRHSRFGELMAKGIIPKGINKVGTNNKVWYEDELREAIERQRKRNEALTY